MFKRILFLLFLYLKLKIKKLFKVSFKFKKVYFLIGFPRSGTTSVADYIINKYNLHLINEMKESHFFNPDNNLNNEFNSVKEKTYLDCSQSYLFNQNILIYIFKNVENPIFIFSIRDYTSRFISHWRYFVNFSEIYYENFNDIPNLGQQSLNKKTNKITQESLIKIKKYLKKNKKNLNQLSNLHLQHIIFNDGKVKFHIFKKIEKQLKKGPKLFFQFEKNFYKKNASFLPYASILAFNYYGQTIKNIYKWNKIYGNNKILIINNIKKDFDLPKEKVIKKTKIGTLNKSKKIEFSNFSLSEEFISDFKILKEMAGKNKIIEL